MRTIAAAGLLLLPTLSVAQAPAYKPSYELPHGRQIVAIYVGASDCGPCRRDSLKAAIRAMKPALAKQAGAAGASFAAIGVSLDWEVKNALTFLEPLGEFDEVVLGNNWVNSAAIRYVWPDTTRAPGIPQVILLERTVNPSSDRIEFGPEHILGRIINAAAIESWVARGAPIPVAPTP